MFGQSDRELISTSSTNGSVPQVLLMFNGPITHMLLEKNTTIYKNVMSHKDPAGGVRVIFLTVLSREPDAEEAALGSQSQRPGRIWECDLVSGQHSGIPFHSVNRVGGPRLSLVYPLGIVS
jgi:hypothetical protein